MKIFLSFIAVLLSHTLAAQWYNPSKVPTKLGYKYGEALSEAKYKNYNKALQLLDQCIATDVKFVDAHLSKGGILSETRNYNASVEAYRKAFSLDSVYCTNYRLPFSIALAGTGQFEEALRQVNLFLSIPRLDERFTKAASYRKKSYSFALDYQKQFPSGDFVFNPVNLGDSINSGASEYFPSLTIEGNALVFTRRVNNRNEDFYISRKLNGVWNQAQSLPGNLNTEENEGAQNISQDGTMLVFTGCNMDDGAGSCDLYCSFLTKRGWGPRINLGSTINTEYWESQPSLSPDKKTLFFTARDPSGFGGSDLFFSTMEPNGKWGTPRNMGAGINTSGDESCPFIHADNETLYFTSNGHPGYGGTDLYFIRKQPDGSWSSPQNLGYPVNTIDDEGSLIIASNGHTAYYASDRSDSRGGLDLYAFELPIQNRPHTTYWVQGHVFDRKTKAGLPSTVELTDLNTGTTICKLQTDEEGNYLIPLPVNRSYAFNVNRTGYLFYSETIAIRETDTSRTISIPLTPIEINASIVLNNIFFESNKSELKPESVSELNKIVQLLTDNPTVEVEISGHTDNIGQPNDNLTLSNNRAAAVVKYLLSKGITGKRLHAKGWGAAKPISDNRTEEGRAQNRRTELKVLSK